LNRLFLGVLSRFFILNFFQKLPKVNKELAQKLLELEKAGQKKKKVTLFLIFFQHCNCICIVYFSVLYIYFVTIAYIVTIQPLATRFNKPHAMQMVDCV